MDSPILTNHFYSPTVRQERRGHIPIRSISYKKNITIEDIQVKKEMLATMGKFPSTTMYSAMTPSPTRASTKDSKPGTAAWNPHMSVEFHKVSLGGPRHPTPKRAHANLTSLPNLKVNKVNNAHTQQNIFNYAQHHQQLKQSKTKVQATSAQDNYFKLLYDENRKTFKVEEAQGIDEFYTNEMIMTRISKQGFIRDPQYYATRTNHTDMTIPNEQTIQEDFRFKMPVSISAMENDNALATHVLGGTLNNIKFIESCIPPPEREIKIIKEEKKQIERDIEAIQKKVEGDVKEIEESFLQRFKRLQEIIKEDFVANQNENFKVQKEIVLMQREHMKLEKEIENCTPPLEHLEDVIYGKRIFGLESNEEGLNYISNMNLRPEMQTFMKTRQTIH